MPSNKIETISEVLRKQISEGMFPYGELPTIKTLSSELETTPDTIRTVMEGLEAEAWIYKRPGRAYHVVNRKIRLTTNEETFRDSMRAQGRKVKTENLVAPHVIESSPRLAHLFRVPNGTPIIERVRTDTVDGIVYRYSRKYYLASLLTKEEIEAMTRDTTFNVRTLIDQRDPVVRIEDIIIARTIESPELAIFKTNNRRLPMLEQHRINYSGQRQVLYISNVIMHAAFFEHRIDYAPDQEPKSTEFCQPVISN